MTGEQKLVATSGRKGNARTHRMMKQPGRDRSAVDDKRHGRSRDGIEHVERRDLDRRCTPDIL